jgi:hypothetical protein
MSARVSILKNHSILTTADQLSFGSRLNRNICYAFLTSYPKISSVSGCVTALAAILNLAALRHVAATNLRADLHQPAVNEFARHSGIA